MRKNKIIEVLKMNDREIDKAVKIQGTNYDRKRKLTDTDIARIKKLYKKGYSMNSIAKVYAVSAQSIKYWVDEVYRIKKNSSGNPHTGKNHISTSNRISYKRNLVAQGAL